jgi:hypothetical protein
VRGKDQQRRPHAFTARLVQVFTEVVDDLDVRCGLTLEFPLDESQLIGNGIEYLTC